MQIRRVLFPLAVAASMAPVLFGAGRKEPAQPDSYNYRRGVEAYDEGERELATQYFNKEYFEIRICHSDRRPKTDMHGFMPRRFQRVTEMWPTP